MPLARSLLYRVSPFDPLTFSAVAAFLVLIVFLASYVPARARPESTRLGR